MLAKRSIRRSPVTQRAEVAFTDGYRVAVLGEALLERLHDVQPVARHQCAECFGGEWAPVKMLGALEHPPRGKAFALRPRIGTWEAQDAFGCSREQREIVASLVEAPLRVQLEVAGGPPIGVGKERVFATSRWECALDRAEHEHGIEARAVRLARGADEDTRSERPHALTRHVERDGDRVPETRDVDIGTDGVERPELAQGLDHASAGLELDVRPRPAPRLGTDVTLDEHGDPRGERGPAGLLRRLD